MKKRLLSVALCLCMLLTLLPGTALAAVSDLLGNTGAENQSILRQLSSFTDGDSDKAYALLDKLGLLDEDGNLKTDQSILLDGREMTLAQVESMLSGGNADLTKIVTVGDTPISLGDLKTIIEIETELARIKDTYFSDRAFTQEQLLSLNSLLSQIEYSGLSLQSAGSSAYADDARQKLQKVICSAPGVTENNDGTLMISDAAALALIDAGAFTFDVTYDLGSYVENTLEEQEIPEKGVRLYMNTWVAESDGTQLAEYTTSNNQANVLFNSVLQFTGDVVTVGIAQSNDNGGTAAKISLRNNSLQPQSNGGNVIATLLDANGNVLEQKQTSIQAGQMKGEETVTAAVNFSGTGSRVAVTYGTLSANTSDSTLSSLSFEGLPVKLSDFTKGSDGTYTCALSGVTAASTLVSFVTASASAAVTVNGAASSGSTSVAIPGGTFSITVSVTAGTSTTNYVLTLRRGGGSSSGGSSTYATTVKTAEHGSVTASPKSAPGGQTVTLTVKPDAGYRLGSLTVKNGAGKTVALRETGTGIYTFAMPYSSATVEASFVLTDEANPFIDVSAGSYCYDAVLWAVSAGVTKGTSATLFSPDAACTRAQVVTFLWRAMGSPEPAAAASPFSDVSADAYYYKAVLWAVEKGVTQGTTATTFSPNATVTRAQSVTFLYRAAGSPAVTAANPFTDVSPDAYYANAVLWAVQKGITNGTAAATFGPGTPCTRGQIATFLYRQSHS